MWWIIIGVIVVLFIILMFILSTYNELVRLRNRVENAWAQIDVQLKRRIDLIPNLVEVTKGYAKHESATLEKVVAARNMAAGATNIEESIEANNQLTGALKTLFAVSEAYPDLKANTNFLQLQNELKETEDKIMYARQFYNDTVTRYNTKIQMFPGNTIAKKYNFTAKPLFEATESDRVVPEVKF
jgi:LemA protein